MIPPILKAFTRQVPQGDNRERLVCGDCGFINYVNPKIVVGAVVTWEKRFLLCRRAIEPRRGFWTIPAGFLEEHETTEAGARREAQEEAMADIRIDGLLGVYNIARISQVQLIYRATLRTPDFGAGEESLDAALFDWGEIPWDDLAFPSVLWALNHHREVAGQPVFAPRTNPENQTGNY
jgi:ADP-ribose pyrophosphatase YjhB (NUDIX family)